MTYNKHECDRMCEQLAAYLEDDLAPEDRAAAEAHLASCPACAAVLAELRTIIAQAGSLAPLAPPRDLWKGIESRIATRVTPLAAPVAHRAAQRRWPLAIAAAALIALTAGTTYLLTARTSTSMKVASTVPEGTPAQPGVTAVQAPAPAPTPALGNGTPTVRLASSHKKNVSATRVYDHEITLLDSLVRTRRNELDPRTVRVIEKNLSIIDSAIAESRAALAKDPKSPLLTNRLDNVLGSKVELLRTIAFLPSQS
jgi:anti-sigma factor RsiW